MGLIKNISILAVGNVLAQLIQLLAQPILAKYYDVAEFGVFAQLLAVSTILVVISTLQMHQAMVIPQDVDASRELFSIGIVSTFIVFIIAIFVFNFIGIDFFGDNERPWISTVCAVFTLVLGCGNLIRGWQTARGSFKILTIFAISRALIVVVLQIALGIYAINGGLIFGALIGEIIALAAFSFSKYSPRLAQLFQDISKPGKAYQALKGYRSFAVSGTMQELVSVAAFTLPLYMFSREFGTDTGGQYAMAHRLAWAPLLLIASSASQAIYRHLARLPITALQDSPLLKLPGPVALAGSIGALGFFWAPWILGLVLGHKWIMAGQMSSWIFLWGTSFLLCLPFRICYRVLRYQAVQLSIDSILLVILIFIFIQKPTGDPMMIMRFVALAGVLQNAILVFAIKYIFYTNKTQPLGYQGV